LNEAAGAADASRATLRESCRNVVSWFSVFVFVSFWQLPLIQAITAKSRLKSHRAASTANTTGFLQTVLSKARQSIVPPRTFSQMRASDKTLTSLGIDGEHSFDFDPQRGWATVDFA
jgi:hypothetical protein